MLNLSSTEIVFKYFTTVNQNQNMKPRVQNLQRGFQDLYNTKENAPN